MKKRKFLLIDNFLQGFSYDSFSYNAEFTETWYFLASNYKDSIG